MATFLPAQYRLQVDRFTADGITSAFYLMYKPMQVKSVTIDGQQKKTGYAGKHFFFLGYEALIDEHTSSLYFASPPPYTGKRDNIEALYTYTPAMSTTSNSIWSARTGQPLYAMYPGANNDTTPEIIKRHQVAGWKESDYLDYADFDMAVQADQPIPYALCQWLLRQSYGNSAHAFTESAWNDWYEYALEHCPRFAQEQPKQRRLSNV